MRRFFSRISFRLMAFNLLLVFLPLAAILVLGTYEVHLLTAQRESLIAQGRIAAAVLASHNGSDTAFADDLMRRIALAAPAGGDEHVRVRVIDVEGRVVSDSGRWSTEAEPASEDPRSRVDRLLAASARPLVRMLRPAEAIESAQDYEESARLMGPEVVAAIQGRAAFAERTLPDRGVVIYAAVPIVRGDEGGRVVLLSQSTSSVLDALDSIRAAIVQVFFASIVLAIIISLLVATTIVRPLQRLRGDAATILDRRGRIRRHFRGSSKNDEIGDLARALERLTARLDGHVRFIESFASDISHEFRNPLAAVRTATEMLSESENANERNRFRKLIEREIARMESLIAGVREASLVDALMTREETRAVPVGQVARNVIERHQSAGARVRFELTAGERESWAEAREERVDQVLDNLIDNAIGFSPAGGTIQVRVSEQSGEVIIIVADEGEGIPDAHRERIFDRFFSWRPGAAGAGGRHTGLGLAIVRGIVESYGGSIRLMTGDRGATFEVRLPSARGVRDRRSGESSAGVDHA